ncbi:phosphate ABC transporter permease subunit PstC, partial [[Clostridium] symbiosum]|nr:phosphate ABC transporter permease subunit PstC [[Clostridium] symbiosum]
ETIASLIALEMGTAAADSTHYHALYAAGLVLLVILLAINTGIALLRRRLLRQEGA